MAKWHDTLAIAVTVFVSYARPVWAADDSLSDFVNTYQCSLAGLIAKIVAHPGKPDDQDRFIVLALPGPSASYVQCALDNAGREGLCEASSGWWNNPSERPHFGAAQLAALARLGFSTNGSRGNFQQHMRFPPTGPDPDGLAELMLRALYEGYDARKDMQIEVVAPFALRHGFLPQKRCALIS
jgi:hypothetical protein